MRHPLWAVPLLWLACSPSWAQVRVAAPVSGQAVMGQAGAAGNALSRRVPGAPASVSPLSLGLAPLSGSALPLAPRPVVEAGIGHARPLAPAVVTPARPALGAAMIKPAALPLARAREIAGRDAASRGIGSAARPAEIAAVTRARDGLPRSGTVGHRASLGITDGRTLFDGGRPGTRLVHEPVAPARRGDLRTYLRKADRRRTSGLRPSRLKAPAQKEIEPFKWPFWKRATALTGILGTLAFLPSLLSAGIVDVVQQAAATDLFAVLTANAGLLLNPIAWIAAIALAWGTIPLRILVYRLMPTVMRFKKDEQDELFNAPPWVTVPKLILGATIEEFAFRGLAFTIVFAHLFPQLGLVLALAAASFLVSFGFAMIHGYGSVWTRVTGGMLYTGVFVATGSLPFTILVHFLYNLRLYMLHRKKLRAGIA